MNTKPIKILRLSEVINITGVSRASIYKWMAENKFPQNLSLGGRATGWVSSEVFDWVNKRIEERDQLINANNNGESS